MKGQYKTKEGSKVEVLNFDEANKIAYATIDGESKWYPESDYSLWEREDNELLITEEESETEQEHKEPVVEENIEEKAPEVKKKRTYKKKEK